ncbi:substrate-binding domain-containing protein [Geobacillus subterraneus]|uniref:LacI family DNA-binding transcriptional regulator n=1 Tax=Geobacillus subterraneus TaxID=129338 RepID=UPI002AC973E1|nr:substrate-binding domain-containing protein [Geobacillus subterraneus]WPZ16950.1 substrate-binding domain-containing protein [Geobacillus subterraneus]
MKRITIQDVARLAGVSKSTISQYLNKRYDYMSEETKKRIEAAINELGYEPNFIARSLKQKKTSTIAVIVANILHSFSTKVIRAVEDYCNENGFHVIVCNADDDPEKEANYIRMLRAKQVDGMIVFPTSGNIQLYKELVDGNFPLVFVDRIIQELSVDTVLLDNEKAVYLAIRHFRERGHERIGIITTSLHHRVTPRVERIEGYKKAMFELGLAVRDEYIKGVDLTYIEDTLDFMLSLKEPPTAILAGNDLVLMEILKYVKERKINIPDDLALIGVDDVPFATIFTPKLTTVAQPAFEMGRRAAQLLLTKINNERSGLVNIYRFEPMLIVRDST